MNHTADPENGGLNPMIQMLEMNDDFGVCVKPAGVDAESELPALLQSQQGPSFLPVHRLDRNVSGVMVLARHSGAAAALSELIRRGEMEKEYVALCHGEPEKEGVMEDLLFRDARKNKVFVVKRMRRGVRDARLEYRVLRRTPGGSLVRIRLFTGRTHQIRVQFASRGFPLMGDHKYGARDSLDAPMLFACRLSFPWKGRVITFEILPDWA